MQIQDAHSHWMPPEVAGQTTFFKAGWSDIELLLRALDTAGVEKAVLLYPTSDAHLRMGGWSKLCRVYNEAVAQTIKAHPLRLIGAGILPVDNPDEMIAELVRIRELGLACVSLASSYEGKFLDEEKFLPVFEKAEQENIPLLIHSQIINPIGFERVNDPLLMPVVEYLFDITMSCGKLMMSGILSKFKNLKIVFAHFAGVIPFLGNRFDSTYSMLRSRSFVKDLGSLPSDILRRIYVDTSGVESTALLNLTLEFFGAERILWGSDFPAKRDLTGSIRAVKGLGITGSDKELLLGGNLQEIFT